MRKLFIVLSLLLSFGNSVAKEVNEQEACQKAQLFIQSVMPGKTVLQHPLRAASQNSQTENYYVFTIQQGGFVIVSGEDRMPAILGYGEHGSFDVEIVPCNVKWLLDYYDKVIDKLKSNPDAAVKSAENENRSNIAPLIVTEWGQGSPYNGLCPNAEGGNCITGCVATSMAQVVNYNRWPQGETNIVEAYVSESYHISMPQLPPTRFNWDNMTGNEIARLMLYCGQSVKMDYGPGASGAAVEYIAPALTNVFGYSKSVRLAGRGNYSDSEWTDLIYDELKSGSPVIYNGQGSAGGHSFIVCGYKDQLFYVNWGWNGSCDGYFNLSNLTPTADMDFSAGQTAIVGIQPPAGVGDIDRPKTAVQEMTVSVKALSRESSADDFPSVTLGSRVVSDLQTDATIQVGFGLYDDSGLREVLASTRHDFLGEEPFDTELEVTISHYLSEGDYTIKAINRMADDDPWQSDAGSSDRYIGVTITEKELLLQPYPNNNYWGEDMGVHTIDDITYRITNYQNGLLYRAEVMPYKETEKYAGDIYVPDSITFANLRMEVFSTNWGAFTDSPELTSLSIGVPDGTNVINCRKLSKLEIRRGTLRWNTGVEDNDQLESLTFPATTRTFSYLPTRCKKMKSVSYESTEQITFSYINGDAWNEKRMPALTDVYFASDYPPAIQRCWGNLEVNPNVTIHIPQGTLETYKRSEWKDWNMQEDLPAIPVSVQWDYSGSDEWASCGIACGRGENNVEYALRVPASHIGAYKGCKVTKIQFYSSNQGIGEMHTDGHSINSVEYVFITKPGTDYLVKQPVRTIRGMWNTVVLPEPYIITGDELFVGIGRNKALGFDWANLNVVDDAFYMRVMGSDSSFGMSSEVGVWQKHAGIADWNHPMPIRFFIEGEHLPTDAMISEANIIDPDNNPQQAPQKLEMPAMAPSSTNSGYFTMSLDSKGRHNADHAVKAPKLSAPKTVVKRAANGKLQLEATVRSRSPRPIEVLTIDWTLDNKSLGSQVFETSLLTNHEQKFIIDLPEDIEGRNHSVVVEVAEINGEPDAITANSSNTTNFATAATTHFARRIVMEEGTGTWCGYCPRGIETIKRATAQYPDNFIAIGLHTGDEMYPDNHSYDPIINQFTSVPNSLINRLQMEDPDWWSVKDIIESQKDAADADIKATAIFTSADSSFVSINTESIFGYSDNGTTTHRIAYVVLEDNVGPYIQANYYSDPSAGDAPDDYMNDWYHKDYSVRMLYNDVARGIYDDYLGVEGSLPQIINEGETYSQEYSLKLPETIQDKKNIRIVALLLDGLTGEILNAAQCKVDYDPTMFSSVIAKSYTRYYGDENPAFEYTTEGAALDGKPELVCEAKIDSPVGVYPIIAQRGTISNRIVTYKDGQLTIEKTPLTVSVGNYTREVNQENPNFVLSYEGWKLNEDESVLKAKPRARTLATASSPVGTYEIVVTGGLATNYDLVYVNGVLTVVEASGINSIMIDGQSFDVYSLTGQKIFSKMTSLRGIPSGVYIINHKKVVVK